MCRRTASRAQPSPPIGPSRPKGSSEGSRGAGFHPQVVNNLGTTQPTGTWAAHGRKAPRVQRISPLFAEVRVRRPLAGPAQAGPAGWDRRRRRALQPALARSHDRRCPSGSGWGEAPAACILRGAPHGRRRPPSADGPWPEKARLVSPGSPDGPPACFSCLQLPAGREAREARARSRERAGSARARFRRQLRGAGPRGSARKSGCGVTTQAGRRRATFDAPAGDREISGCARGLFWLQKSTSGAGSTPSGMGLAPTLHAREGNLPARFCLVQRSFCFAQRGEEASWPARGVAGTSVSAAPRGPWRVAACMLRRTVGYGRQRCRTEGQGSP